MPQIVYYHPGAGTEASKIAHALGGAFGIGVAQDIVESYRFICDNYNPGDEIIIIGFSRGAFTARSVAAMVCALGFLNRPGLDQLPYIFHDYETWQKWDEKPFDEKKHLVGFTLEHVQSLRRKAASQKHGLSAQDKPKKPWELWADAELEAELRAWKKRTYENMSQDTKHLGKMAEAYQHILAEV